MQTINVLLLVEDDENDIILTERKIQRSQLPLDRLVVARTLAEAKSIIAGRPGGIDVVLLDLNLGDSRGLDTLASLRPVYDGVLIVLTSIEDEMTGIDAIRTGANDYLVKNTLTEERLRSTVAYALVRHYRDAVVRRVADNLKVLADLPIGGG